MDLLLRDPPGVLIRLFAKTVELLLDIMIYEASVLVSIYLVVLRCKGLCQLLHSLIKARICRLQSTKPARPFSLGLKNKKKPEIHRY